MTQGVANEGELYLMPGGPLYRLARRSSFARKGDDSTLRRIIALVAITWLPMFFFAIAQGCAIGPTPRDSFLLDFSTYARFFVGLPLLIFAEKIISPRLSMAGRQFLHDGLVGAEDHAAFEKAIARLARRREAVLTTLAIAALAAFGAWRLTLEATAGLGTIGWRSLELPDGHALRYSLAALWNHIVAVPVVLFLTYRWIWRVVIWTLFLFDVSRLDLKLVPTHADRVGGLGFLETAHMAFATIAFGIASVVAAEAAFRIVYEGASIATFQGPLIGLLVLTQVLFLGPLLVFTPAIARARRAGVRTYGALVSRYNRDFHEKWMEGSTPGGEPLLGTADIQSLADIGNSYRFVDEMRLTAFSRTAVIELAVATALPGIPLLLLVVPMRDIIEAMVKVVR